MFDHPKTLAEAQNNRYGAWAAEPKGRPYVRGRCAYEVHCNYRFFQCSRKNGHGADGLYCKTHAKVTQKFFDREK